MHVVAEKTVGSAATAWHCCLEFYSVSTRLPAEYRLSPAAACRLLEDEVLARVTVCDLPPSERLKFLQAAAHERTAGERVYDAHIAEIARAAGAEVVVTDNRRHFIAALRHGIRVETPTEFLANLKGRR